MLLVLLSFPPGEEAEEAWELRAKRLVALVVGIFSLTAGLVFVRLADAHDYVVKEGDTLSGVAHRLGVSVEELAAANGIDDPDFLVAGQLLVVPSDGGSATEYVVRKGETLGAISERVGIPVVQLAAANGLTDVNSVPAGLLLSVPPVGMATPAAAAPAASSSVSRYTVRPGDALSDIALRLGVPLGQLAAANNISDPNLIVEGQTITVPNAWECPVAGGSFVNEFGYVNGDGNRHNGVDVFAPRGTPIVAPVGGTVELYPNPSGGQAIQLYGRDGNRYYFAHLDEYGDSGRVAGGDVVGYVGNTGDARATSAHVHFEIHPGGGEAVNPFPSLVAACR